MLPMEIGQEGSVEKTYYTTTILTQGADCTQLIIIVYLFAYMIPPSSRKFTAAYIGFFKDSLKQQTPLQTERKPLYLSRNVYNIQ